MVKREEALQETLAKGNEVVNLDLEEERVEGNAATIPQLIMALEAIFEEWMKLLFFFFLLWGRKE